MGLNNFNEYNPANDPGYQNSLALINAGNSPRANISSNTSDITPSAAALQRYQAQLGLQGTQYSADAQKQAALQASQLQYNLGSATLAQSQGRYNQLFPLLSGQVGRANAPLGATPNAPPLLSAPSYGGAANPAYGGGYGGPAPSPSGGGGGADYALPPIQAPNVPAAPGVGAPPGAGGAIGSLSLGPNHPVLSEGQIQQQVNAQRATNDAGAAGQVRRQTQDLAGRGVGANSPLARAIQSQVYGQNLNANTTASTNTRLNAAQLNAANQQAYDLANQQSATALGAANIGARASEYGAAQSAAASQYGSAASAAANEYGAGLGAQASMYGSLQSAQASRQNAINAALASNYNAGLGYNASTYGDQLAYQANLAQVQASRQNSILAALAGLAS